MLHGCSTTEDQGLFLEMKFPLPTQETKLMISTLENTVHLCSQMTQNKSCKAHSASSLVMGG